MKENFSVKVDGKEYWISRSVAVVGFIFHHNEETNQIEALVEKRGPGAADYQGCMCVPCGYLNWSESGEEGIARESLEECGVKLSPEKMVLFAVDTRPTANRQNISLYYTQFVDMSEKYNPDPKLAVGGEKDEVSWAKWVPVARYNDDASVFEGLNILNNDKDWAFGHNKDIDMALSFLLERRYKPKHEWEPKLNIEKIISVK